MGLSEHIRAGALLQRTNVVVLDTFGSGSGSVNAGGTYGVLGIIPQQQCRLRLYDTEQSRDDLAEISRSFGQPLVSASTSLIADLSMSSATVNQIINIDPVKFGHANSTTDPKMYWRLDPVAPGNQVIVIRNLLEDLNIEPNINTFYKESNRRVISIGTSSLQAGPVILLSGSLSSFTPPTTPATYMLISASLTDMGGGYQPGYLARFRLYSSASGIFDATEKYRPFSTEPAENVYLVVDMIMTGSETIHFVPKIFGANVKNMGTNLESIKDDASKVRGQNEMYYTLENLTYYDPGSPGGVPINAKVNLYVYALED